MEQAILVTVDFGKREDWTAEERSLELRELAHSAGTKVMSEEIVHRHSPDPGYFIGTGKAEELAKICADKGIKVVIFNNDLTGTQQKNLEDAIMTKTIDRTQLILDIFARRAHSNEGKIQVELAQLLYLLPRLTGKGIYLSRLGGGIGTRGPGEQKLEVDRRKIRARITRLENVLEDLSSRRAMMRKKRERFSILTIAIIGYTNVGKSTLLNALTDSNVIVEDKLFSTLDPTVRRFILPNKQKVLFVDTVGFLDRLPHHLVEAFKATLEEVVEADLLLHLVDISHPKAAAQSDAVYRVLDSIGAKDKTILTVLNKIDRIEDAVVINRAKACFNTGLAISALKRKGFDELIHTVLAQVNNLMTTVEFKIPASDARVLNLIYENGLVIKKEYEADSVHIKAQIPIRIKDMLAKRIDKG
ncbi:MAG: GTPase HflX [Candidatus Omnitrophica bacterium]|nr:GTPase HflX [Candidatus Omnitrophota bacterium]